MLRGDANAHKWLSKTEFYFFKQHKDEIQQTYNYAMSLTINRCVQYLYDYFQKHLPGFFNKLCNIIFFCDIVDLRKIKADRDLYDRYLRYAKKFFDRDDPKFVQTYNDIFKGTTPQTILLQRVTNGFKKFGLVDEEDRIYWWITFEDLKVIDDFIFFTSLCKNYEQCINSMKNFWASYFSKPSIYMNEEKTQEQLREIAEHKKQVRLELIQKIKEIKQKLAEENNKKIV